MKRKQKTTDPLVGLYVGFHHGREMEIRVQGGPEHYQIDWADGMSVTCDNPDTALLYLERDHAEKE